MKFGEAKNNLLFNGKAGDYIYKIDTQKSILEDEVVVKKLKINEVSEGKMILELTGEFIQNGEYDNSEGWKKGKKFRNLMEVYKFLKDNPNFFVKSVADNKTEAVYKDGELFFNSGLSSKVINNGWYLEDTYLNYSEGFNND